MGAQYAFGLPIALFLIAWGVVSLARGRETLDPLLTATRDQLDPDDEAVARAGEAAGDPVDRMMRDCNARRVDRDPLLDRILMRAHREERARKARGMAPGHPERLTAPIGDHEQALLNALRDATWPEGTPS